VVEGDGRGGQASNESARIASGGNEAGDLGGSGAGRVERFDEIAG
jgi:hypothetical protein